MKQRRCAIITAPFYHRRKRDDQVLSLSLSIYLSMSLKKYSFSRRIRVFKRWMKANGLTYSDALELLDSPSNGISIRSLRDLVEGEDVATIPKRACLTIKNSAARRMILDSGLAGHLGLSVAIMYERSLGITSPWFGYLQILPEMECSPLIWSSEDIDTLLLGTELHKVINELLFYIYK